MENIVIRKIKRNDIEKTAKVFADAFNYADNAKDWNVQTGIEYIEYWLKRCSDMFFIATVEEEIVGGMAGDIKPFKGMNVLTEIVLFVSPKFHKLGIAKKLVESAVKEAVKKYDVVEVNSIANSAVDFPMGWYERIGLQKTEWIFIEGKAGQILNNLKDQNDKKR